MDNLEKMYQTLLESVPHEVASDIIRDKGHQQEIIYPRRFKNLVTLYHDYDNECIDVDKPQAENDFIPEYTFIRKGSVFTLREFADAEVALEGTSLIIGLDSKEDLDDAITLGWFMEMPTYVIYNYDEQASGYYVGKGRISFKEYFLFEDDFVKALNVGLKIYPTLYQAQKALNMLNNVDSTNTLVIKEVISGNEPK